MSYIYLASPYSDEKEAIMQARYEAACLKTANLLKEGLYVYSPIVHCHELARKFFLPTDFNFWWNYNFNLLEKASAMYILGLPGWTESKGVAGEIQEALKLNLDIKLVMPNISAAPIVSPDFEDFF